MITRLRRLRDRDEGFAMAFAMMITTVVLITVTTVMVVVQPGIAGAKRSQDTVAAFIAARSGIDDAIAYLMSIPSCRATTRICTAATQIGNDASSQVSTAALAAAGTPRPALVKAAGTSSSPMEQYGQSFSWIIDKNLTPEGFLRVRSTGTYQKVSKTLVADLALNPSILGYGYYTDYESLSPDFLQAYYKPRSIYLDDSTTCSSITAVSSCSTSSPKYANWSGPANSSVCAQHWYADGSIPGRAVSGTAPVTEPGRVGTTTSTTSGTSVSRTLGCDLTFSSAMVQNGKTFTRDAILTTGSGPKFNQPVYTRWGFKDSTRDYSNPAFPAAGQYYRITNGTALSNSPFVPAIANFDLTLPPNIGKDGIPDNACVYTGPTRVKLNGDGTATVTSPLTRAKNTASDPACYPASVAAGVVGFRYSYNTVGGGAIVTRNQGAMPGSGWPANPTRATQTPSASNEIFYFTATGTDVPQHTDKSGALSSGCTSTVKYSAAPDATCAWTTVGVTTEGASLGWTSYTKTTCGSATATNRELFECEYANSGSTASPAVAQAAGQYKTVRDAVQTDLAKSTCLTGTATAQASCVNAIVQAKVNAANSASTTNGAHRYVATTTAGTPTTSTTTGTQTGPDGTTTDTFFTQPTPASESLTQTPLTTVVKRQVYSSSSSSWGSDTAAFTLTTTQSDYAYTAARGMTYFPNEDDVTAYNTGTDAAGTSTIRGTAQTPQTGDRQPGDLYIDGKNKGKLSVLADNDVVVTGDITNPANYTPATDAVSITAGQDVRNYHPVSCDDQDVTDINNTATGWCPNDFTGLSQSNSVTTARYDNMQAAADRSIQAVVFALNGSFGTDNYNRGAPVGNVSIFGGLYQSHRGGNGVVSGNTAVSGATLQYTYVDLQRAALPYVPQATFGNEVRPWNVVGISTG